MALRRGYSNGSADFEEIQKFEYPSFLDWFIKIHHPADIWRRQPTYLLSEALFLLGGLLTFIHAMRSGGRFRWLWLGTVLHGLFLENICFWFPEIIDNYWHSQTVIVLLGRRLPLHILCLYSCFIYVASVAVSRLRLPNYAEPFAVGLVAVLIDIPYDIVSVKFVHWTWHDTDKNIYDRHYWVPWNSYYFHSTFAASFTFFFHFWRRKFATESRSKWESVSAGKEFLLTCLTAVCGMPGGILLFIPLYHPLHDIFGIHNENCVLILFIMYVCIIWSADRHPDVNARPSIISPIKGRRASLNNGFNEVVLWLMIHYPLWLCFTIWGKPENEISVGMHEQTGPCDKMVSIPNAIGMELPRRQYFCVSDYDENYFDFHCTPTGKPPGHYYEWYTICGMPFENRAEYISMIAAICVLATTVFYQFFFRSGPQPSVSEFQTSKRKDKRM